MQWGSAKVLVSILHCIPLSNLSVYSRRKENWSAFLEPEYAQLLKRTFLPLWKTDSDWCHVWFMEMCYLIYFLPLLADSEMTSKVKNWQYQSIMCHSCPFWTWPLRFQCIMCHSCPFRTWLLRFLASIFTISWLADIKMTISVGHIRLRLLMPAKLMHSTWVRSFMFAFLIYSWIIGKFWENNLLVNYSLVNASLLNPHKLWEVFQWGCCGYKCWVLVKALWSWSVYCAIQDSQSFPVEYLWGIDTFTRSKSIFLNPHTQLILWQRRILVQCPYNPGWWMDSSAFPFLAVTIVFFLLSRRALWSTMASHHSFSESLLPSIPHDFCPAFIFGHYN